MSNEDKVGSLSWLKGADPDKVNGDINVTVSNDQEGKQVETTINPELKDSSIDAETAAFESIQSGVGTENAVEDHSKMFGSNVFSNPTWNMLSSKNASGNNAANAPANNSGTSGPNGFAKSAFGQNPPVVPANNAAMFGANVFANTNWSTPVQANFAGKSAAKLKAIANNLKTRTSKYPEDCYSFLALHGPMETKQKTLFFFFGLVPFIFQMLFLILLTWSETRQLTGTIGENDNPSAGALASFIPANTSGIVSYTQVVAVFAYVVFPDSSLKDMIRAVQLLPQTSKAQSGDPVNCMRFSCFLRGIQGTLAMLVTLLLIATSDTVVDIILNFTAVNFISNLDDYAFLLAMSGDFGPTLQEEAERISGLDLPPCLSRNKRSKFICNLVVVGTSAAILFGLLAAVIIAQKSDRFWTTKTFRVQFQDSTGLNKHSGCYRINDHLSSIHFSRRSYDSIDRISNSASFGYCRQDRRWILFEGDGTSDPCDASMNEVELARSPKTDTFDISTSFDASWVSASNTPLDMYFFDNSNEMEIMERCSYELGDGICDSFFNELGYDFDGGDCCASTCTGSKCGRGDFKGLFVSTISGTHFPNCSNPAMVPITIHLNDIVSSRDPEFAVFEYDWEKPWESPADENTWRNASPVVRPYFSLDCANKNVLTVYIDPSMKNHSETVLVEDSANCTLVVQNATTENRNTERDDPIWLIDYTLFHGENTLDTVPILNQHSGREDTVYFKRIPDCYFEVLNTSHINFTSIYDSEAVKLLALGDSDNSQCEDDFFVERFALFTMLYLLKGKDVVNEQAGQCTWPSIKSNESSEGGARESMRSDRWNAHRRIFN